MRTGGTGDEADAKVLLVCSTGGHLAQLHRLEPWWRTRERVWVTFDKPDSQSLLEGERCVWAHHPTTRNLRNLVKNTRLAWRVLRRFRPDVIVSTGAGVAFPFFLGAKLVGARTVYVEVYDRIDTAPLTSRLCYPLSDLFCVQWPEQQQMFPKSEVLGALL